MSEQQRQGGLFKAQSSAQSGAFFLVVPDPSSSAFALLTVDSVTGGLCFTASPAVDLFATFDDAVSHLAPLACDLVTSFSAFGGVVVTGLQIHLLLVDTEESLVSFPHHPQPQLETRIHAVSRLRWHSITLALPAASLVVHEASSDTPLKVLPWEAPDRNKLATPGLMFATVVGHSESPSSGTYMHENVPDLSKPWPWTCESLPFYHQDGGAHLPSEVSRDTLWNWQALDNCTPFDVSNFAVRLVAGAVTWKKLPRTDDEKKSIAIGITRIVTTPGMEVNSDTEVEVVLPRIESSSEEGEEKKPASQWRSLIFRSSSVNLRSMRTYRDEHRQAAAARVVQFGPRYGMRIKRGVYVGETQLPRTSSDEAYAIHDFPPRALDAALDHVLHKCLVADGDVARSVRQSVESVTLLPKIESQVDELLDGYRSGSLQSSLLQWEEPKSASSWLLQLVAVGAMCGRWRCDGKVEDVATLAEDTLFFVELLGSALCVLGAVSLSPTSPTGSDDSTTKNDDVVADSPGMQFVSGILEAGVNPQSPWPTVAEVGKAASVLITLPSNQTAADSASNAVPRAKALGLVPSFYSTGPKWTHVRCLSHPALGARLVQREFSGSSDAVDKARSSGLAKTFDWVGLLRNTTLEASEVPAGISTVKFTIALRHVSLLSHICVSVESVHDGPNAAATPLTMSVTVGMPVLDAEASECNHRHVLHRVALPVDAQFSTINLEPSWFAYPLDCHRTKENALLTPFFATEPVVGRYVTVELMCSDRGMRVRPVMVLGTPLHALPAAEVQHLNLSHEVFGGAVTCEGQRLHAVRSRFVGMTEFAPQRRISDVFPAVPSEHGSPIKVGSNLSQKRSVSSPKAPFLGMGRRKSADHGNNMVRSVTNQSFASHTSDASTAAAAVAQDTSLLAEDDITPSSPHMGGKSPRENSPLVEHQGASPSPVRERRLKVSSKELLKQFSLHAVDPIAFEVIRLGPLRAREVFRDLPTLADVQMEKEAQLAGVPKPSAFDGATLSKSFRGVQFTESRVQEAQLLGDLVSIPPPKAAALTRPSRSPGSPASPGFGDGSRSAPLSVQWLARMLNVEYQRLKGKLTRVGRDRVLAQLEFPSWLVNPNVHVFGSPSAWRQSGDGSQSGSSNPGSKCALCRTKLGWMSKAKRRHCQVCQATVCVECICDAPQMHVPTGVLEPSLTTCDQCSLHTGDTHRIWRSLVEMGMGANTAVELPRMPRVYSSIGLLSRARAVALQQETEPQCITDRGQAAVISQSTMSYMSEPNPFDRVLDVKDTSSASWRCCEPPSSGEGHRTLSPVQDPDLGPDEATRGKGRAPPSKRRDSGAHSMVFRAVASLIIWNRCKASYAELRLSFANGSTTESELPENTTVEIHSGDTVSQAEILGSSPLTAATFDGKFFVLKIDCEKELERSPSAINTPHSVLSVVITGPQASLAKLLIRRFAVFGWPQKRDSYYTTTFAQREACAPSTFFSPSGSFGGSNSITTVASIRSKASPAAEALTDPTASVFHAGSPGVGLSGSVLIRTRSHMRSKSCVFECLTPATVCGLVVESFHPVHLGDCSGIARTLRVTALGSNGVEENVAMIELPLPLGLPSTATAHKRSASDTPQSLSGTARSLSATQRSQASDEEEPAPSATVPTPTMVFAFPTSIHEIVAVRIEVLRFRAVASGGPSRGENEVPRRTFSFTGRRPNQTSNLSGGGPLSSFAGGDGHSTGEGVFLGKLSLWSTPDPVVRRSVASRDHLSAHSSVRRRVQRVDANAPADSLHTPTNSLMSFNMRSEGNESSAKY